MHSHSLVLLQISWPILLSTCLLALCCRDHSGEPSSAGIPLDPNLKSLDENGNILEEGNILVNGMKQQQQGQQKEQQA